MYNLRIFVCAAALSVSSVCSDQSPLTPAEQVGKKIYRDGIGTRPVRATIAGGIEARGTEYPCIACHGEEGKGGREGGARIADISASALAAARRGAYDDRSIARAIAQGVNATGGSLDALMPRYDMADADTRNLLAYLKRLGNEPVPGVSEDVVRVGMLLPEGETHGQRASQARSLLEAYFTRVNDRGGIYGRKLHLEVWAYDARRLATSAETLRARAAKDPPFCFLANLVPDTSGEAFSFVAADDAASLAPLALPGVPEAVDPANVFYVYAGPHDQARVLVDYLVDDVKLGEHSVALLHADDVQGRAAVAGAREQAKRRGFAFAIESVASSGTAKDLAATLKRRRLAKIVYFGPPAALAALASATLELSWPVTVFGSAELLGADAMALPADAVTELTLISSVGIADPHDEKLAALQVLAENAKLPTAASAFQMTAFAGAKLLEETLKQTGRGLTRASFLRHLKATRALRTDVSPDLTYGDARRSGSRSAMILKVDRKMRRFVAVTDFREPK
jgi:ABC-type branched-subunit amino acid transport system substrate-binding protein